MLTLATPVEQINKIGKATAKKLQRLEIKTVQDLLQYYPFRYEDYSQTVKISELRPGTKVNVRGVLEIIQNRRTPRQRMMITEAIVGDETGQLKVVWFNQPFIGRTLKVGDQISLAGEIKADLAGVQMVAPEYERLSGCLPVHTAGLVPIYSVTANLSNKQLRFLIKSVIGLVNEFHDFLPGEIQKKYNLIDLPKALRNIHFPQNAALLEKAKRRLKFDELFLVQLTSQIKKSEARSQEAEKIKFFEKETKEFVKNLPFELTNAQKKAAWEILQDIGQDKPMSRLLEGDVGSGKTVTVALAMLNAALNKKQSVLLVPTEILASQHFETLCKLFKDIKMSIGLFTRSNKKVNSGQLTVNSKKEMISAIKDGQINIIVGTHTILQEDVEFKDLALAIIDEQHRFGVEQRKALRQKSGDKKTVPHLLAMTATPIPRSLAQAIYGDLDLSIINEMPKGRKPIQTFVVPEHKRYDGYSFIKKQIEEGRQAFVICPLISPSDKLGVKSVEEEYKKLNEIVFKDLKIAYLHGRMPARSGSASGGKTPGKEEIMQKFLNNEIKILVSTSVVEVGVDVPNATIMMIEGAERFGLAQLHQFRGRVGRSEFQSYCLLFPTDEKQAAARLNTFAKNHDGFKLAEEDLKMRGPGEVYGTAQKGFPEFKIADLNDHVLIKEVREAAERIVNEGAEKYPELLERIKKDDEWVVG
ncbi:DNA helicase RecG [Candidatus Falkowbacteria bacterium CG10_big_fil_rev_8_21_14_0_10_43_10]|uniref:ATP-dependent DNA helicase RecG n=1 Tax=Candidatus Falkowbacteria bacterium CG10_big_fil_rev_8_21_14_0_10_43_10 TaxID=1974567 RepID=A0A2H0V3Z6_9BACT|nr:MAG: DNA helicase RecG [Candidatus Falkowbacteria bacterium CG10_big_fil_rev_8_21_14_0_10_43_10]